MVQAEARIMKEEVKKILLEKGINYVPELDAVFHNIQPFLGLETEYWQKKYFRNKMQLLVRNNIAHAPIQYYY